MIDLVLWAADKPTFRTFAINNNLLVDDGDGGFTERRGFTWVWWAESGKLMTAKVTARGTDTVDQVSATELAINVGATPPEWVKAGLLLMSTSGEQVGSFNRIQGNFAVFDREIIVTYQADGDGDLVLDVNGDPIVASEIPVPINAGDTVEAFSESEFLPGFVALCRIHGDFFETDHLEPLENDPEKEEQWARSKVARYIKNNGTPGTVAGGAISYYEIDGVRIFRPTDVFGWLQSRGLPGHEWLGGNSF